MRLTILVAAAAILTPAALSAAPAHAPGLTAAQATDFSAAKKKPKVRKAAAPKEEYLKAAPSAEPKRPTPQY
jgi:hypothetical protein